MTSKIVGFLFEKFWDESESLDGSVVLAIIYLILSLAAAIILLPVWLFEYYILKKEA